MELRHAPSRRQPSFPIVHPGSRRYERSERTFGDVLSSLNAHVTARMAEAEYLFRCVEQGKIEVAWPITGAFSTKLWLDVTTDLGSIAGRRTLGGLNEP